MEIIETIDSVVNHRTGEVSTMKKFKPKAPMMGKVSIQLIDENGNVEQEASLNNIAMNWLTEMCYKTYYDGYVAWRYSTSGSSTQSDPRYTYSWPLRRFYLTDWTGAENANTPMVCGRTIGWAETGYLYSGSSTTQGSFNNAEHKWRINENDQRVFTLVYDFPTHAANGTFQSVWLCSGTNEAYDSRSNSAMWSGSEVHYLNYNADIIPQDLKDHMNTWMVSRIGYGNGNAITVQDGELITIKPQNSYYSSSNPYPNDPWRYKMVIMIWDAKSGKYKEHRIVSEFNGANYASMNTNYANLDYNVIPCKLANNNIACIQWKSSSSILIHWIDPSGNSVDHVTLDNSTFSSPNGQNLTITARSLISSFASSAYSKLDTKTKTLYLMGNETYDGKRLTYLIAYNLQTKTHTIKLINPLINPYVSSSYRDNVFYFIYAPACTDATIAVHMAYLDSASKWQYSRVGLFSNDCTTFFTSQTVGANNRWSTAVQSGDMKAYINTDNSYYVLDPGNIRPTTHTLLPAPITKTQSHTMKVTYQIITDMLVPASCDEFFRTHTIGTYNTDPQSVDGDSVFLTPEVIERVDLNPHLTEREPVPGVEHVATLEIQGGNE